MIASALAVRPPSRAPARPQTGVLRRCACGASAQGGECAKCGGNRIQRSGSAAGPAAAPPIVHDVLRSPGQPLDGATRAMMEPRFGHSFANVRVHADGQAAESAAAVGAQAYAVGRDIVFGAGKHAPSTHSGRRLMAHELAHVVQQSGSAAPAMQASLEVGSADAPEERQADAAASAVLRGEPARVDGGGPAALRRTPGQNAQESWNEVVDRVEVRLTEKETAETAGRATRASEAVSRMLQTAEGAKLANDLFAALCRKGKCGTRITVIFADTIPGNEAGIFQPDKAGAGHYTVWIKNVFPPSPGVQQLPGGCWPGPKAPEQVCYSYGDPETGMAATLQHETMHVWFINTQTGRWDTGHGDVEKGQIEPVFLARLKAMAADLDALEKKIHAEQAAKKQQQAPPPVRDVPLRERDIERDEPARPRRKVGGEVSLQVGGAGGGGLKSFSGILGADLILGDIASLRLGARGVYLTPGHLLAGGTVGTRLLETGGDGGKADRPLFFDIEAGVLGEVAPADAGRFTDRVAGFASAGFGQEYGQAGARFFWRVGGFVLVSDRAFGDLPAGDAKPVAFGGTFGVGARF